MKKTLLTLCLIIFTVPVLANEKFSIEGNTLIYDTFKSADESKAEINEEGRFVAEMDPKSTRTSLITDETRVYKGGSWKDRAYWLDPAQRRYLPQYISTDYIGFRCAIDFLGRDKKDFE